MPDSNLLGRVEDKTIAVIGLGYVGFPLALALAKNNPVIGFDTNIERINSLKDKVDANKQASREEFDSVWKNISLISNTNGLFLASVFIVTVPTPVDSKKVPDLSALASACKTVGKNLSRGGIVIFESTVYPGCTEEFCVPILEANSGRKLNLDFFVGYSPERVNPGDKEHTLSTTRKIVSASAPEAMDVILKLYSGIIDIEEPLYQAPSIKVAEAAKVIENTQRDINIAFVNELAMIFDRMDIDTHEVLKAARTKWNFLDFRPGLVGGHCIGVDPYYLAYKAVEVGHNPKIILSGRDVNESVGPYIARSLVKGMMHQGAGETPKVLILGCTFKENCPDTRNSKVNDIIDELLEFNCTVQIFDPQIHRGFEKGDYDGIVVAVAHDEFKSFDWASLKGERTVLFDVKGIVPDEFVDIRL